MRKKKWYFSIDLNVVTFYYIVTFGFKSSNCMMSLKYPFLFSLSFHSYHQSQLYNSLSAFFTSLVLFFLYFYLSLSPPSEIMCVPKVLTPQ